MRLIASLALVSTFAVLAMGSRIRPDNRESVLAVPERNVITLMDYNSAVSFANFDPIMAKGCCYPDCGRIGDGDCVWLPHTRTTRRGLDVCGQG